MRDNDLMSKKIDAALDELIKALRKHAKAVDGGRISLKKTQRAAARLQTAASAYSIAVYSKSGLDTPFNDVASPGLEGETLVSLEAERDDLAKRTSAKKSNSL